MSFQYPKVIQHRRSLAFGPGRFDEHYRLFLRLEVKVTHVLDNGYACHSLPVSFGAKKKEEIWGAPSPGRPRTRTAAYGARCSHSPIRLNEVPCCAPRQVSRGNDHHLYVGDEAGSHQGATAGWVRQPRRAGRPTLVYLFTSPTAGRWPS